MTDAPLVLVTGAAGFVGAAVTRLLVDAGARVLGVDDLSAGDEDRLAGLSDPSFRLQRADVVEADVLDRALDERPVAVLHLAGRVGVRRVLADPEQCERENLAAGEALADALVRAAERGITPRVLAASTSEVYAESTEPLAESSALRPLRAEGRWRYAASKRACEATLDDAHRAILERAPGAPEPIHLRFFNVVGPGQDGSTGMVLPRFVEAALAGLPLEVHGTGESVRTYAHVDAVARDVAALTLPGQSPSSWASDPAPVEAFGGPLNVGGTARATVSELARCVQRIAAERGGTRSPLVRVDPRLTVGANFAEVSHRVPDLSTLHGLGLGREAWSLEDLVRDTVARHAPPRPAASAGDLLCASPAS